MSAGQEIRLIEEDDWLWSAIDEESGVASAGATREEALAMLDEAIALHTGETGDPLTDEDLATLGIDPAVAVDEPQVPDAPWFDDEDESA